MRPRHLLHIFSTFGAGGAQIRMTAVANLLGPEFVHTFMAMDGNFAAAERCAPELRFRLQPPPAKKSSLGYPFRLGRLVRRLAPDLVATYNWGAMDALAGTRLFSSIPIIHNEHGFGPDEAVRLKLRRVLARRLLLRGIHKTVVPSKTLLRIALTQYRVKRDRVQHIPNGVDVDGFRPQAVRSCREEYGIPATAVTFGFTGNLRPEKNLDALIRAYALAGLGDDARLMIVGNGACREEWRSLARDLNLQKEVIFTGQARDTRPFLAAFDVFVMSSVTEQASMALLEAMASGLPAVCTDVGDTRELLGTEQSEFVTPVKDVDGFARRLRVMAQNPELRSRLGAENRERCVANYTLERMADEYRTLYRDALQQHRAGSQAGDRDPGNELA